MLVDEAKGMMMEDNAVGWLIRMISDKNEEGEKVFQAQ